MKLSGLKFVITGTLSHHTRNEMKEIIENLGGSTSESVSKKTTYLVAGENPGSKYEKAQKFGIKILTEEMLEKLINS